jgi:hypothetical protein
MTTTKTAAGSKAKSAAALEKILLAGHDPAPEILDRSTFKKLKTAIRERLRPQRKQIPTAGVAELLRLRDEVGDIRNLVVKYARRNQNDEFDDTVGLWCFKHNALIELILQEITVRLSELAQIAEINRAQMRAARQAARPRKPQKPSIPPPAKPLIFRASAKRQELQAPKPRVKTRPAGRPTQSDVGAWRWQNLPTASGGRT